MLIWKFNRLRAMGASEVLYRMRRALQARREQRGHGLAQASPPAGSSGQAWLKPLPHGFEPAPYYKAADRILTGRFDVFAMRDAKLGFPPQWNRDPKIGTVAPLAFGKTLNYRDGNIVGNVKYLWEPNRHGELVKLAQAWHLSGNARYAEGCWTLLESWFEQCPYPLGVNWTSSLEHAVRLANWAVACQLLGEETIAAARNGLRERWLASIYQHCHFIAGHLSRHSSANNHLLGELMGLFIGTTMWPMWPESAQWKAQAARELEEQVLLQNAPDGVNREQAIWYQHEATDMMLLAGLIGRANGHPFPPSFWARLETMLEFVSSLMDVGGNVPMIGDGDDGRLVPFAEVDVFRSLLATGAVLFGRSDFKAKAVHFDDKSRWLLGDEAERRFSALPAAEDRPRQDFPDGGYAILGDDFGTSREIRIVADAGALGYLSLAAHGHADALAFTLSAGGYPLLIDPGTYSYQAPQPWRDYFRGTSAHNTLRVDGLDQSTPAGAFLWLHHAQAARDHLKITASADTWEGHHDGYRRLRDPLIHRRRLDLDKTQRALRVTDRLECGGRHRIELFWHAHEACEIHMDNGTVELRHGQATLRMTLASHDWLPRIIRGQEDPPLGWVSRHFDLKTPCSTIVWEGWIEGNTTLTTEIGIA